MELSQGIAHFTRAFCQDTMQDWNFVSFSVPLNWWAILTCILLSLAQPRPYRGRPGKDVIQIQASNTK